MTLVLKADFELEATPPRELRREEEEDVKILPHQSLAGLEVFATVPEEPQI